MSGAGRQAEGLFAPISVLLGPGQRFPTDLARLSLEQVQVLHSRLCCQLDHEYLTDPHGPHPVTVDRCREVVVELHTRARHHEGTA